MGGILVAVVAVIAALSTAGCERRSDADRRSAPEQTAEVSPEAAASVAPADPSRAQAGSPDRVILQMLRYIQLGAGSLTRDLYDPRVWDTVDESLILQAFRSQSAALAATEVVSIKSEPNRQRRLVTVELAAPDTGAARQRYLFLLRRKDGRWRIAFDTLLSGALEFIILEKDRTKTGSGVASPEAVAAARRLVTRLEQIALDEGSARALRR